MARAGGVRVTSYRDATPGDGATLDALFRRSFTVTFGHLYAPADLAAFLREFTPARGAAARGDPGYAFRLAEQDGAAGGYATLGPPALPGAPAASVELRQLYLADAAKGTGVAPALMDWAIATARARGATALWLSVYVENDRARRFYERYGFEDVGRYSFMVGSHEDEDRLMRLPLPSPGLDPASRSFLPG